MKINNRELLTSLVRIGLVLTPLIILIGTVPFPISCYTPLFNDEISHYHQISSFVNNSWSGGYYTWNENAARTPIFNFGNWGPGFIILYGLIGKAVGWSFQAAILFNLLMITIVLTIVAIFTENDKESLLLKFLILITFAPLIIYLSKIMQTVTHISFGMLFAVIVAKSYSSKVKIWRYSFGVLLVVCCLIQFTWILMYPVYILVTRGWISKRQIIIFLVYSFFLVLFFREINFI